MAGKLRSLRPHLEPTGRTIMFCELVGGDPRQSRMVPVQLGARDDRADFHEGFCRARVHGSFDQCGRRPYRDQVVCGVHGGGHVVRQRAGIRLSPQQAGRLSGLARRIKRDGKVDLSAVPTHLPWLQERVAALKGQPERLDIQDDLVHLTALRDLLVHEHMGMDITDLVRLFAALVQAKAGALRAKAAMDLRNAVPIEEVQSTLTALIRLLERYVPAERHAEVERELVLLGAPGTQAASADDGDAR